MINRIFSNIAISRCVIGLLQGVVLYLLYMATQNKLWPASQPLVFMPLLMVSLFIPLVITQAIAHLRVRTMLIWVSTVTLILICLSYYSIYRQMSGNENISSLLIAPDAYFFFATCIALFISEALVLSSDQDNRIIAHYSTYFDISWKLGIQILFITAFVVCFWILLWLGSGLFSAIHLNFFKQLITQSWFAIPVTTLAITLVLHVTDVNVRIIYGIRSLILVVLSWLLPLVTGIITLFLISLFFTGLSPLWQTGHAGLLLLFTAMIMTILINVVYQNHFDASSLPFVQRYAALLACYLLMPLTLLTICALSLRVQQYGWSVDRIYAAAFILIIASYSLGYLSVASLPNQKFQLFKLWNVGTAILILALYLTLFTPVFDPARLMVNNQVYRLQAGQVKADQFDFAALSREGLIYGHKALQIIQNSWLGPESKYIRSRATQALQHSSLTELTSPEEKKQFIITHPTSHQLPSSFLMQKWGSIDGSIIVPACLYNRSEVCHAWIIHESTILILSSNQFTQFQQDTQKIWRAIGTWVFPYSCSDKLHNAALQGKFKIVPPLPSNQDMLISGIRLNMNQNVRHDPCNSINLN